MERAQQLIMAGTFKQEDDGFWRQNWPRIASAKVPLEKKVATYHTLKLRGVANINGVDYSDLYEMIRADRAFVTALDLARPTAYLFRVCVAAIEDDVAALASLDRESDAYGLEAGTAYLRKYDFYRTLMEIDAPHCLRFLLRDKAFREFVVQWRMTPLVQRLVEELVQPTDHLQKWPLLSHGQSVKLIRMCVPDEELVAEWLPRFRKYPVMGSVSISVTFARKLHALATPNQHAAIKTEILRLLITTDLNKGCCELGWLFGLLGPFDPTVQVYFLKHHVRAFPAYTFAMIVAMCDGYLTMKRGIKAPTRRFFALVMGLPMDLQALVALRLWGRTSTVIRREAFDRALLAIV
jgi:hypothetical protein